MTPVRIAICNERFLPRFGVDRFLVLLAQRLVNSGHEVSFHCLRSDRAMLQRISRAIYQLTTPTNVDMVGAEKAIFEAAAQNWGSKKLDVMVTGGWPFFETAAQARNFGARSIFIDAGAVAQNGMPDSVVTMQLELRRIRQLALPLIDRVLPISQFIRETQSEPDRGTSEGIRTVLLGADHMHLGTFIGDDQKRCDETLRRVEHLGQEGKQLILLLGRFEGRGYKASLGAYDLLRAVRGQVATAHLLLLDAGQDCAVPKDLISSVELLGAPDDHTLQMIMSHCAAGVSMSTWEGFNLPLAEMQWLGRSALAFNIGAHPEVAADPWQLCETVNEMTGKLVALLRNQSPVDLSARFAAFREKRTWKNTLDIWEDEVSTIASRPMVMPSRVEMLPALRSRIVLVDLSNASLDPANPGVIRVARRLCSELQHHTELNLIFAGWAGGDYLFLNARRRELLQGFGGPKDGLGLLATCGRDVRLRDFVTALSIRHGSPPVLFFPEVILDSTASGRIRWARENGFRTAVILYDLIPILHPELCGSSVSTHFPSYLDAVLNADAVWSISQSTLNDFAAYAKRSGRSLSKNWEAISLPGQFGAEFRQNAYGQEHVSREIRILCVSTLEPRKNHLRLLKAFQDLRKRRPELPVRLVLIGNRYLNAPEIAQEVEAAGKRDRTIEWHGIVDDSRLAREFKEASFTVYPSTIEGYGLPILESLWMGRPCLTHDAGVMQELAASGGCIVADMNDVTALSQAMESLATNEELRTRLSREAANRHIKNWEEYGGEIAARLAEI